MAKMGKAVDPLAKQKGETHSQWQMRLALAGVVKDDERATANPYAKLHGDYRDKFVMHVETNTRAKATVNALPTVVEGWFTKRHAGFEQPARAAIERCIALWAVRPQIGNLAASYCPTIKGGSNDHDRHIIEALDDTGELDRYRKLFHPAHWSVFENVVRWDNPAGTAGQPLANNAPQSIASARAVVGLVANVIALHMGA